MKKWLLGFLVVALMIGIFVWKNQAPVELTATPQPLQAIKDNLGEKPIFVYITSDNCPYCVKMRPIIKEVQDKYGSKLPFVIANAGKDQEAVTVFHAYQLRGVPAVVIHDKEGNIVERFVGLTDTDVLEKAIKKVIGE